MVQNQVTVEHQKLQPARRKAAPTLPGQASEHPFLQVQDLIGNHGLLRLADGTPLQRRLEVGAPDDEYEREADRVADEVMTMPDVGSREWGVGNSRRAEPSVRLAAASSVTPVAEVAPEVEVQIQSLRSSGGRPLSATERSFFEPRFGRNFGAVRMHTSSEAAESARAVNARAYTVGQHVAFGAGTSASSGGNRRLLAHELAHVLQQRVRTNSSSARVQMQHDKPWYGKLWGGVKSVAGGMWEGAKARAKEAIKFIESESRLLDGFEVQSAKLVFGGSIDYGKVRIYERSLTASVARALADAKNGMGVTTLYTINFDRKVSTTAGSRDMAWLIHELTHVAQYERVGAKYMVQALRAQHSKEGYKYGPEHLWNPTSGQGKHFREFNHEQQGDIAADYYTSICKVPGWSDPTRKFNKADYDAVINELRRGDL